MSTERNDGGPAFPPHGAAFDYVGVHAGMSLRDYFAAKAMQGMLAHGTRYRPREQDKHLHWHDALAKEAREIADAMLAERPGPQPDLLGALEKADEWLGKWADHASFCRGESDACACGLNAVRRRNRDAMLAAREGGAA